jgi:hypothetical protein
MKHAWLPTLAKMPWSSILSFLDHLDCDLMALRFQQDWYIWPLFQSWSARWASSIPTSICTFGCDRGVNQLGCCGTNRPKPMQYLNLYGLLHEEIAQAEGQHHNQIQKKFCFRASSALSSTHLLLIHNSCTSLICTWSSRLPIWLKFLLIYSSCSYTWFFLKPSFMIIQGMGERWKKNDLPKLEAEINKCKHSVKQSSQQSGALRWTRGSIFSQ